MPDKAKKAASKDNAVPADKNKSKASLKASSEKHTPTSKSKAAAGKGKASEKTAPKSKAKPAAPAGSAASLGKGLKGYENIFQTLTEKIVQLELNQLLTDNFIQALSKNMTKRLNDYIVQLDDLKSSSVDDIAAVKSKHALLNVSVVDLINRTAGLDEQSTRMVRVRNDVEALVFQLDAVKKSAMERMAHGPAPFEQKAAALPPSEPLPPLVPLTAGSTSPNEVQRVLQSYNVTLQRVQSAQAVHALMLGNLSTKVLLKQLEAKQNLSFAAAHEGYNKRGAKLEAQEQKIAAMRALLSSVEAQVGPLVRLELELNTSKNRAGLAALGDILALLAKWKQAVPKVQAMHRTEQRLEARFTAQALQIERLTMGLCCLAALSLVTIVAILLVICRRPADATPPGEPKAPTKATPPASHRVRSVSSAAAPPPPQQSRKGGGKKNRDLQRSMSVQMSSGSSVAVQEETKEQL